eukprot:gnl/Chilomastix_caulleri/4415.p1 GENE.gnl/Chilomastix_caulleri/4415~~gnl/Chilomastix_caulleri/4415.p1  ORF type:complete len:52 (+),score=6.69 gnl/Chilomastix_caulleri/4415:183-338(+)
MIDEQGSSSMDRDLRDDPTFTTSGGYIYCISGVVIMFRENIICCMPTFFCP